MTKTCNAFTTGFDYKKKVIIISEHHEEIAEAIIKSSAAVLPISAARAALRIVTASWFCSHQADAVGEGTLHCARD